MFVYQLRRDVSGLLEHLEAYAFARDACGKQQRKEVEEIAVV